MPASPHPSPDSEGRESSPQPKYRIHIEKSVDSTIEQRRSWLDSMMPLQDTNMYFVDEAHKQEYQNILTQWSNTLPFQSMTIADLRKEPSIPAALEHAIEGRGSATPEDYRDLGRDILNHYNGQNEGRSWKDLSEQNKKFTRLGELIVIATDTMQAIQDLRRDYSAAPKVVKLAKIVDRYKRSADIPPLFDAMIATPLLEQLARANEQLRDPQAMYTPWETSPGISGLWGKGEDIQEPSSDSQTSPTQSQPVEPVEIITPEKNITEPTHSPPQNPDDDVIDMQFNEQTGAFEAESDTRNSKTKRIEYDPDDTSGTNND